MALSPMMAHYLQLKEEYKDSILFYRLGDFYELFYEDAEICSRVLELTLTGKQCGVEQKAPMCGVPFHSAEPYIAKLISLGYKVAVCEQLTNPSDNPKELVKRDVVRVITPGTVVDSGMLQENKNNYLCSVYKDKNNIGVSYIDITTGEFNVSEFNDIDSLTKLNDLLVMIKPSEIICNSQMHESFELLPSVISCYIPRFSFYEDDNFDFSFANELVLKQLNVSTLKQYNCNNKNFAICSAGALLNYVKETQKRDLSHINSIEFLHFNDYMQIDANTRRNLEITETNRDRKKRGSLLWLLDKTRTSMGSRMLRSLVEKPLFNDKLINKRLNAVEELTKNLIARDMLYETLYNIYDIERLTGKISYGNLTPKDCISLKKSLKQLPKIKEILSNFNTELLEEINNNIGIEQEIVDLLEDSINEDCSNNLKEGNFIKHGYNSQLDDLKNISKIGKEWISQLEAKEKELTQIKNLKISYNKIFGYYIEVTNSQKDLVPYRYKRRQTLANAERYITDELKEMEDKILNAEELKNKLESELFNQIRDQLLYKITSFQRTSKSIALLDAIYSLAQVAVENNYCKPIINKSNNKIEIIDGRHPIVEVLNRSEDFVPNDTILNDSDCRTMIITGPNMAGKSTYMRQVAVITLMAHIGSFVPAKSAKIALTDKIFTRIGASDDLAFGQSTFMVEMLEVSNIIKNATNKSLIILDEVGRGTSTFDGLSIAQSVMEYVSNTLLCKTLFATHFHELTELEGVLDGVKNYRISVKEFNNSVIFLRKIVRGGANKSFGIEVASLAELPEIVISRAREILHNLELKEISNFNRNFENNTNETLIDKRKYGEVINILNETNINSLTPLNAFDLILQLKQYLKRDE